jgi:oxygen-independent coproporphyrinogen-3 oxidase
MITEKSKEMMTKSFHKTAYRYQKRPSITVGKSFGIYIHVPFCFTKCAFCPFYKELYDENKKQKYLEAIQKEIETSGINGEASWVYIGGGTPNTLKIEEVELIIDKLRKNISVSTMGIELLPSVLDIEYIEGLQKIGFTKISVGVESLSKETLHKSGRKLTEKDSINKIVECAQDKGLWVNVDLMIGLPKQTTSSFIEDIQKMSKIGPDQITIYPFMQLGKLTVQPSLEDKEQFEYIERANEILIKRGYKRKGIWTFAKGDEVYDSSRDELIEDYIGFGPAAFSTYGSWKVVNPELAIYLKNYQNNKKMALVAEKEKMSDDWRTFARMLYDLKGNLEKDTFLGIKLLIQILRLSGYIKKKKLTKKGIIFTHSITKTVVENLPYPLQNTHYIENYEDYLSEKD